MKFSSYILLFLLSLCAFLCASLTGCSPAANTPHDHTAVAWTTVTPPTCDAEGYAVGTCVICGEEMETTLPTTAHTLTDTVTPPTCEEQGYTRHTCACGYTYDDHFVKPAGHDLTITEVPPTCEEQGYTRHTCACGYTYDDHFVKPAGHDLTITEVPPTCEEQGYTRHTCACGYTYDDHFVKPAGHDLTITEVPPTCETAGSVRYACPCGYTREGDPIPPLDHANATAEVFHPTLDRDGFTRHTCPDCGLTYEDTPVAYRDVYTGAYVSNTEILMQGIDTSKWNHEYGASLEDMKPLDFATLKALGVDFVILKAGSTTGIDPAFERDYLDAKAAGLQVGAYFYAYSVTVEDTLADAEMLLTWLEGKQFELPIYFDMEETSMMSLGGDLLTQLCRVFVTRLQEAGYYAALYTNTEWLYNLLDTEWVKDNLDVWYARYTRSIPEGEDGFALTDTDFSWKDGTAYKPGETDQRFGMWQYTDSGIVEGFRYRFDFSYAFKDYKSIMEAWGLNGFGSPAREAEAL